MFLNIDISIAMAEKKFPRGTITLSESQSAIEVSFYLTYYKYLQIHDGTIIYIVEELSQ